MTDIRNMSACLRKGDLRRKSREREVAAVSHSVGTRVVIVSYRSLTAFGMTGQSVVIPNAVRDLFAVIPVDTALYDPFNTLHPPK